MPFSEQSPSHPEAVDRIVDLPHRLKYLCLTEDDAVALRELMPIFEQHAEQFVEEFYEHLFSFEETARFLQDSKLVEKLKQAQRAHFQSILKAKWDSQYIKERKVVGDAHADVGIEPEVFLGGYNQYILHFLPRFLANTDDGGQTALQIVLPLIKVVFLDIGMTLDAYFQQATSDLRRALDLVWKANSELRQFAQLTSHDLKTPLATVANLCDEAIDEFGEEMPGEAKKLIEAARDRTFRMSRTIDEMLETSVSPTSPESFEEVAGARFIGEALERLRLMLHEKDIQVDVQDPLPAVWGNRVRLREVFYNLISNAAKFIDRKPGKIEIAAKVTETECVYTVADNGPGIPEDELLRVFSPFSRLPEHRSKEGSGLGLYFAKALVEQQGGRIWVESQLGSGSRFFVAMPRGVEYKADASTSTKH